MDKREELNDILVDITYTFCNGMNININKACDELMVWDEFIKHNKMNSEEKLCLNILINVITMTMSRIGVNKKGIRLIKLLYAIEDRLNSNNDIERWERERGIDKARVMGILKDEQSRVDRRI